MGRPLFAGAANELPCSFYKVEMPIKLHSLEL